MGLNVRLVVPNERSPGKINVHTIILHQGFPNYSHLLSLCNRVGRYQGGLYFGSAHHLRHFVVPTNHIIDVFSTLWASYFQVSLLFFRLICESDEWRVSHNIVQFLCRNDFAPVHP